MLAGVAYGPDLHLGRTGWNSDNDLEVGGEKGFSPAVHLLDEALDHHLGRIEVGNDTVPQWTDRLDARVGVLVHQLCLLSDRDALLGIVVDGYDARLVKRNLVIVEDDCVGGSEVHSNLLSQKRECHMCFSV